MLPGGSGSAPAMNFLPAELVSSGGGPAVALANGVQTTVLKLPGNGNGALGNPGRKVIFGVRPENLTRHDSDRGSRREVGLIEAPVEVVEPTGAETIVVVRFGDREIIARFEPDEAPKLGDRVTLAVDMAKVCLFDPETQQLI